MLAVRSQRWVTFVGYQLMLLISAVGVGVTAHFGGVIMHGSDYLTEVLKTESTLASTTNSNSKVSFAKDIHPILQNNCFKCHGNGKNKGGFRLDSRDLAIRGGKSGPAIVVGKSSRSLLFKLVSGLDTERIMPKKGARLTDSQLTLIKTWIDQGLEWDDKIKADIPKVTKVDYKIKVVVPPQEPAELNNPIDRFIYTYLSAKNKEGASLPNLKDQSHHAEDRIFIRRAYLDLLGILPSLEEVKSFLQDNNNDKREKLVAALLARDEEYAQHWLSFWNDALRNDYEGTGYVDGGRRQITDWLYDALLTNMSYNKLAQSLIKGDPKGADGFIKGIVWRGNVNANEKPEIQAAQNIGQVFMGANIKCASCHDSFVDDWTLKDAYGMASVYAKKPLQIYRCEEATGQIAAPSFLYPELGAISASLAPADRRAALAELVTTPQNGRFSRTIVNRLWAKLMGRGLVEPVDELDQPPWSQELLDWLADDFVAHDYDMKHTLLQIATSRVYQLPALPVKEDRAKEYVFAGPLVKRLTAEQFLDALYSIAKLSPKAVTKISAVW